MPSRVEYYKDTTNQWRWRAIAQNGRITADSAEAYHNRQDCEAGYASAMTSHVDDEQDDAS